MYAPPPTPQEQAHAGKKIILYSSDEPDKKANAAVLMVLYAVSLSNQLRMPT